MILKNLGSVSDEDLCFVTGKVTLGHVRQLEPGPEAKSQLTSLHCNPVLKDLLG